ncbi:MAG: hypothetical protein RMM08_06585 [Armatimonadota bacterium]|nr:Ig-like domain-containing protein [bacterium]MDW8321009.1 hypothetical protein [Armatimonadota bacterium]
MKAYAILGGMCVVMLWIIAAGCGGGGGQSAQPQVSQFRDASGRSIRDTNGNGIPDLPLDARPTIVAAFSGFAPRQVVEIQVFREGAPLLPEPILLTTDNSGNIPPIPVLWDIGVGENGQAVDASGSYLVVASGEGRQASFSFEVLGSRLAAATRQAEQPYYYFQILHGEPLRFAMGSIPAGDEVWVGGANFPPNQQVRIYIVRDRDDWTDGMLLEDESGGAEEVTILPYLGELPSTRIWTSAQRRGDGQYDGDYDVVVDVNRNGRYDSSVDLVASRFGAGFTVQVPPPAGQHLAVELAASQYGSFKDEFFPLEAVSVWVNPPWRPLIPHDMVRKYVVLHKDDWQDGDPLVDVTGRPEWDLVRRACRNQYRLPVWYSTRPGRYDVVIDIDRNGVYTKGVDLIDAGITPAGDRIKEAGFIVQFPVTTLELALDAERPVINANRQTTIRAQVLTDRGRPVAGATVRFEVVGGRGGSLSSTSATTNSRGVAQVNLSAAEPDTNIVVRGTVTFESRTARAEVTVRVRAFGELQATFE